MHVVFKLQKSFLNSQVNGLFKIQKISCMYISGWSCQAQKNLWYGYMEMRTDDFVIAKELVEYGELSELSICKSSCECIKRNSLFNCKRVCTHIEERGFPNSSGGLAYTQ